MSSTATSTVSTVTKAKAAGTGKPVVSSGPIKPTGPTKPAPVSKLAANQVIVNLLWDLAHYAGLAAEEPRFMKRRAYETAANVTGTQIVFILCNFFLNSNFFLKQCQT